MEASFKSRVEQAFGALLGSSLQGVSAPRVASVASPSSSAGAVIVSTNSWSVSEVAIPCNQGSRSADESSGSESDEPSAARYEKFVQLAKRARRRRPADDDEGFNEENDVDGGRGAKRRRTGEVEDTVSAENVQQDLDEDEEIRQMRLMVGMDDTLDFEEEEDEYDKLAVGREGAGERVYMREIRGVDSGMGPLTSLPVPVVGNERRRLKKDSRANHAAAAARLKEDDRLAAIKSADVARMLRLSSSLGSFSSGEASGINVGTDVLSDQGASSSLIPKVKPALKSVVDVAGNKNVNPESSESTGVANMGSSSNGAHQSTVQSESGKDAGGRTQDTENMLGLGGSGARKEAKTKRVRFAVDDDVIEEKETVSGMEVQEVLAVPVTKNRYGRVPDHVRNPAKYTHYTLEWSDEEDDNKANLMAFHTTQAMTHATEKQEALGMVELPKSITFMPRSGGVASKSNGEAKPSTGSAFLQSQALMSFADEVVIDSSPYPEETSHSTISTTTSVETKTVRVFRKRAREEEEAESNLEDNAS